MKTFYKEVLRERGAMIEFLMEHCRYHTMNSWNGQHSYANCVKLQHLGLTSEQCNVGYDMLQVEDSAVFDEIEERMRQFAVANDWQYQASFNGRSNGYIVLMVGGKKPSEFKTRCNVCGAPTYYEKEQSCHRGTCPGTLVKLKEPIFTTFVTCAGIDQDRDYETWENDELISRVRLVQSFDKMCDDCVKIFVNYCDNYKVVEREIMVPRKIKVLEEK